ncbi:MAG: mercury(II) reductase [Acidimicrobiales bacterium]
MTSFDLVIVGGGTAAVAAASQADEMGATVALINSGLPLGGTCVNVGCVPSKALVHTAEVLHQARNHGIPGLTLEVKELDFARIVEGEQDLVKALRHQKYETVLPELVNVTVIDGRARFLGPREVAVNDQVLTAGKVIIATGSTAVVPPIPGLRDVDYLTHVEALALNEVPERLAIVGGGPLGVEFAQILARFGTQVTLLQRASSIVPAAERELTQRLAEVLTGEGITVATGVEVERVDRAGDRKLVTYRTGAGRVEVDVDAILLAVGKTPNTRGLGIAEAGVAVDDRQAVVVDVHFETSQPGIFAIGDVNDQPVRENPTAGREGTLAAQNALAGTTHSIDYDHVPTTVFTDPQLASVGVTEAEQLRRTGVSDCRTLSFENVPKAVITRRTEGLVNMVTDPATNRILGVHVLAPNASEIIAEAMILVRDGHTVDDVTATAPMYPTLSEAIKIVALSFTRDVTKLCCSF